MYEERVESARLSLVDIKSWIISTLDTCGGKPRIRNTRLRVRDIIEMVKNGEEDKIYQDYKYVTKSAVDACLIYNDRNEKCVEYFREINETLAAFLTTALELPQDKLEIKYNIDEEQELTYDILDECIDFLMRCEQRRPGICKDMSITLVDGIITLGYYKLQTYINIYRDEDGTLGTEIFQYRGKEFKVGKLITFDEFMNIH